MLQNPLYQRTLGIPTVEKQQYLPSFQQRYHLLNKIAGQLEFRPLFCPHPVTYGYCQIADEWSFSFTLARDRDTQRQTDEAMAIHIGLARMAGMVMQQGNGVKFLAKLRYRRIIDAEEDRIIL